MLDLSDISLNSKELVNNFNKEKLIDFDLVKDMLSLAELVYDFDTKFKVDISNNKYDLDNLNVNELNINKVKKKLLEKILKESPNCEIINYYNLKNGTQVGITVSHKKQRISIIFRGTNQIKDWLYDLMICKTRLENDIYVHSGFYKCLLEYNLFFNLLENIKNLIKEYPEYELILTGHSLGAALATLCGYLLTYYINTNITVISFASPRIGNKKFAEDYNNKNNLRHFRFVNGKDIVTAIPYFFYYHVGKCILINKNSKLDYKKIQDLKDYSNIFKRYNVFDHFIEKYYDNLILCKW